MAAFLDGSTVNKTQLSVLTLNIWFESFEQTTRYNFIVNEMILKQVPTIVCLQEVTFSFVKILKNTPAIQELYNCSDNYSGDSVNPYGVLTLIKKELKAEFSFHKLDTLMNRSLLVGQFEVEGSKLAIGNVHLESLSYHNVRIAQLKDCRKVLSNFHNSILVGDFNFCSYRNFNLNKKELENDCLKAIVPDYLDLWPSLNDSEKDKGYTFDTTVNKMLGFKVEHMRYDRILSSLSPSWRAIQIELVGNREIIVPGKEREEVVASFEDVEVTGFTTPIKKLKLESSARPVFPSDHFGLVAIFEKTGLSDSRPSKSDCLLI